MVISRLEKGEAYNLKEDIPETENPYEQYFGRVKVLLLKRQGASLIKDILASLRGFRSPLM